MPGPGGGGYGGGGGRGGGFGGGGGGFHGGGGRGPGFGGGGFHGGPHHHPPHHHPPHHHRPYYGGWHFGGWYPRRRYYGGGGCLGAIMAPVILVIFLLVFLLSMCQNGVEISTGDEYNEELLNDYADDQYALHFSKNGAYEDNLLIVVLTTENNSDFYYIAWKGDHLAPDIVQLMGNNATALGKTMNNSINESNYKYSLDSDLANVLNTMTDKITALGLDKSFTCSESRQVKGTFVNNTDLPMTESTLQAALDHFAATTGIPTALVVEDATDVFVTEEHSIDGLNLPGGTILLVVVIGIVVIILLTTKQKPTTDE